MDVNKKNSSQRGQKPTDSDNFYLNWGMESLKNNIILSNEILKQILSLSTALLSVSIIYENIVKNDKLRIVVLIFFFFSLALSLFGLLPYEGKVTLNSPSGIEEFKRDALKHKRIFLWFSGGGLISGFAIILVELIMKLCV